MSIYAGKSWVLSVASHHLSICIDECVAYLKTQKKAKMLLIILSIVAGLLKINSDRTERAMKLLEEKEVL
jgi:hypothetical protein